MTVPPRHRPRGVRILVVRGARVTSAFVLTTTMALASASVAAPWVPLAPPPSRPEPQGPPASGAAGADQTGGRGGAASETLPLQGLGGAGGAPAAPPVSVGPDAAPGSIAPVVAPGVAPEDNPPSSPAPVAEVPVEILVLERGTRSRLEGAAVTVDAQPVGETDSDGRLTVMLPLGAHQIEAQFPIHKPVRESVEVSAGRKYAITLRLDNEADGERYETEVRSRHREVSSVAIDAREATQVAGTSGDPVRVLAALPGVAQAVWPAAIFVVRGSNPGNTGFFIDGIRVPALFHVALGPSLIAPELLSSLDFYPGAYPANFGRYISGVVSIHSARPPEDRVHVSTDFKFYEARAVATAPIDHGQGVVAAAFRYSFTRPLLSLLGNDTIIDYSDYQLRADHALAGGQVTMFAFGSVDRLDNRTPSTQTGRTSGETGALQFHRLDLRWSGPSLGGRLLFGVTGEYDHAQSSLAQAPLIVTSFGAAPRLMWSRRFGSSVELDAGADAEYQHFETEPLPFGQGKLSDLGRSRPALTQGTFLSLRFLPSDRLTISPGIRGDLFAEEGTSRYVAEPRLDARFDIKPWFALLLNLGRFSQMPSLPVNVAGFESFGLASIGLQQSDAISGGVNARAPDDTTFELIGFYQRMRVTDVTDLDLQSARITGDNYLVLHDGIGYGLQAMIRRPNTHRLSGWLSYTLSYSLRNGTNGVVRSDWDQRHVLNLVMAYRGPAGVSFGGTLHYHTGREVPMLAPMNTIGMPPKRVELPAFYRLDLRIERRFVFDRFILTPYLDVANVTFNSELVQYVATNDGSKPSYLRVVLPTLGLIGAF
ncbi:MAG TPA: PEGA domain-containing protein [Polyangia bacterium]